MPDTPAPAAPIARALATAMIRKGVTILGTAAVSRGLLDQGTVDGVTGEVVELTLGVLSVAFSAVWSWMATTAVHARLEAALAALRGQDGPAPATPPKIA